MRKVLIIPFPGLCYFLTLRSMLEQSGYSISTAWQFPIRGILVGSKFDVIHIHMVDLLFIQQTATTTFRNLFLLALLIPFSFFRRIKIVWTCHEWTPHELTGLFRLLAISLSGFLLVLSQDIVVHSQENERLLKQMFHGVFSSKIKFISHGTLAPYYQRYEGEERSGQHERAMRSDEDPRTYVFAALGFMRPNKGTDLILRAFRNFKHSNARLLVIGNCIDDRYYVSLQDLAAKDPRISIQRRNISDIELINLHRTTDAIIFGFRACPTSGSVITALSLGAFVIAPALGHCVELVRAADGILYDPSSSPDSLSIAIGEFVSNHHFKSKSGNQSQSSGFGWAELPENHWPYILRQYDCVYGS